MFRRHAVDFQSVSKLYVLPPVQFNAPVDPLRVKQGLISESDDEVRTVPGVETFEGLNIQMVVMVVADEYEVNRRQVFESQARGSVPSWACPTDRTGPLGPDRVGENIEAVHLNKHGRMIDEGDAQTPINNARGRRLPRLRISPLIPTARLAIQLPAQEIYKTFASGRVKITEPVTVEVIRLRAAIAWGAEDVISDQGC